MDKQQPVWKSAESIEGVRVMRDVEEYEGAPVWGVNLGARIPTERAVALNLKGISTKRVEELNRRQR